MATRLPGAGLAAPGAARPEPTIVLPPDSAVQTSRSSGPGLPWYLAPEFRALAAVRRAFLLGGVPSVTAHTPEAGARQAAYWTLYQLGHALDEIERRTRQGSPCWSRVSVAEHGPGRVVIHIAIEPVPGDASSGAGP